MPERLYIDFETRSPLDVSDVGAFKYAAHPDTQPICLGYAFDDEPAQIIDMLTTYSPCVSEAHKRICDHIKWGGKVVAHNAIFDVLIWNKCFSLRILPAQVIDTKAKCNTASIPASLSRAAGWLKLPFQKATTGKVLIGKLSRPLTVSPLTWYEKPAILEQLRDYCKQDVEVLRAIDKALPDLSAKEQEVWLLDWAINERGIGIDQPFLKAAIQMVEESKMALVSDITAVTNGEVTAPSEVKKLTEWVKKNGVAIDTLAKNSLITLLGNTPLPPHVRKALEIRQHYAKSSTAKLERILNCLEGDGRIRGQLVYHGTSTGRWSGALSQPQNLSRIKTDKEFAEATIQYILQGDKDMLEHVYPSILEAVSGVLRGIIVARAGFDLVGGDLASIEARIVAWLANQKQKLDLYRNGEDIYCYTASKIYGRQITESDTAERFIGKVAELALGYQGGHKAFERMAGNYGVVVPEEQAKEIVRAWRDNNDAVVWLWRSIESAALTAMKHPGVPQFINNIGQNIQFRLDPGYFRCVLPSGRELSYPSPTVKNKIVFGKERTVVSYMGELAGKTGMFEIDTYGGLLLENIAQGIARDVMVSGMKKAATAGAKIVLTVHDELLAEVPSDSSVSLRDSMIAPIVWADGLPLDAKEWRGKRYLKG